MLVSKLNQVKIFREIKRCQGYFLKIGLRKRVDQVFVRPEPDAKWVAEHVRRTRYAIQKVKGTLM